MTDDKHTLHWIYNIFSKAILETHYTPCTFFWWFYPIIPRRRLQTYTLPIFFIVTMSNTELLLFQRFIYLKVQVNFSISMPKSLYTQPFSAYKRVFFYESATHTMRVMKNHSSSSLRILLSLNYSNTLFECSVIANRRLWKRQKHHRWLPPQSKTDP